MRDEDPTPRGPSEGESDGSTAGEQGTLVSEIRQTRPFRSRAQEATLGLLHTADRITRRIDAVLAPEGITQQQYNVLRILRGAGEEGIPTLSIAQRMIQRTPGITRLIDRLLKKGLVRRERTPTDRRQVLCHVTEPGLELLARLEEPVNQLDEDFLGTLEDGEIRTLIGLLDRIRADMGDD